MSYTINDGNGNTDSAFVNITVMSSNDFPVAINYSAIVFEDSISNQIDVLDNDYDPDGDNLTITSVSQPLNGTSSTDGLFVYYTPDIDYFGSDQFDYVIDDGFGGTCSGEVLVNVPLSKGKDGMAIDDGALYDSTIIP